MRRLGLRRDIMLDMTLIISTICPDGIVLTSDGRAVDVRTNEILTNSAKKLFHLGNEVYLAYSGQGIPRNMGVILTEAAQENLNFSVPHSIEDICNFIKDVITSVSEQLPENPGFSFNCVITGYDRGVGNQKLQARHFTLSSEDDYKPVEGPGLVTMGAKVPEDELDILQEASKKNVKASNRANKKLIGLIAETNIQVGGKIILATVRKR